MEVVRNDVFIVSLRQQVIFPAIRTNIPIPQEVFQDLFEHLEKTSSSTIGVVTVRAGAKDPKELYDIGTFCRIASHSTSKTKVGNQEMSVATISVEGQSRFQIKSYSASSRYRCATVKLLPEDDAAE